MKIIKFIILIITIILLVSCRGELTNKQLTNSTDFDTIEREIKRKFGADAYFTDLSISYNKSIGNIIGVTVTDNPESLKMGQWNYLQGAWKQNSEITLEVPKGSKAADFMFQLNEKIKLSKLGELVEKSSKQLIAEKDIKKPMLHMAFINFPKNGDIAKAEYVIMQKSENSRIIFTFSYKLNGDLIKMNYKQL